MLCICRAFTSPASCRGRMSLFLLPRPPPLTGDWVDSHLAPPSASSFSNTLLIVTTSISLATTPQTKYSRDYRSVMRVFTFTPCVGKRATPGRGTHQHDHTKKLTANIILVDAHDRTTHRNGRARWATDDSNTNQDKNKNSRRVGRKYAPPLAARPSPLPS